MHTVPDVQAVSKQSGMLMRWLNGLAKALRGIKIRKRDRSLRLCETLPLGDKRFLAVVQFNDQRLLIGATTHSISVLQAVDGPGEAAGVSVFQANRSRGATDQ